MKKISTILFLGLLSLSTQAMSPYLSKVWEYNPAPGQFVNVLPEYEEGDTQESMRSKAEEAICFDRTPGMISLGGFGGYVTVSFDHPVVNLHGRYDFKIYGNAFVSDTETASSEPGIVMVSADTNGNGLPDDEWYELAGSEYTSPETFHHFSINYFRPSDGAIPVPDPDNKAIIDTKYIRFTTNDPSMPEGFIQRNTFHTQKYWPEWITEGNLTFTGTRLPDNVIESVNAFSALPFAWGYADNEPNTSCKGFSLDWAVDSEGKPVILREIDFIRIYTAECQQMGWLGEESTEVSGGEDLHPDAVYSPEWPENPEVPGSVKVISAGTWALISCHNGALHLRAAESGRLSLYSINGELLKSLYISEGENLQDISDLTHGIYILSGEGRTVKLVLK